MQIFGVGSRNAGAKGGHLEIGLSKWFCRGQSGFRMAYFRQQPNVWAELSPYAY